jgi:hypothetical protein
MSVAIGPRGAAVADQPAEKGGTEIVIASANVKETAARTETDLEIGTVTVIGSDLDLVNETTTGTDPIVAAIEVEIGIVVVTIIVLDELGLPPADAHARALATDLAAEIAPVHVHDPLLLDGALVPSQTCDEGHDLVADPPHDGPLPALWTSTVMCL